MSLGDKLNSKQENVSEEKPKEGQSRQDQFPKWLQDILAGATQNPELAGLVVSLGTIATGAALLLDDAKDFGKDGSERNPPMPHHWLIGALTLIGGVVGACTSGLAMLKKTMPQKSIVPKSFLKQAIPMEKAIKLLEGNTK
jgi:hypothetical protein